MTHTARHRGRHPEDDRLFAPAVWPALRTAVGDLAWLLSRGYPPRASLKVVGDRYRLAARQRVAVLRATCSEGARRHRRLREVTSRELGGGPIAVDGYNVLITVEAALADGVLLLSRDGCLRDMASLHGSFRRVEETEPALVRLGAWLAARTSAPVTWYLDAPVSNSGRLAAHMRELAAARSFAWIVEVVNQPDAVLVETGSTIASSDSAILDGCGSWLNLARRVVEHTVPAARWIDLGVET